MMPSNTCAHRTFVALALLRPFVLHSGLDARGKVCDAHGTLVVFTRWAPWLGTHQSSSLWRRFASRSIHPQEERQPRRVKSTMCNAFLSIMCVSTLVKVDVHTVQHFAGYTGLCTSKVVVTFHLKFFKFLVVPTYAHCRMDVTLIVYMRKSI
jgi:hypothetical protein